jgi:class 3 adenylate cyclase
MICPQCQSENSTVVAFCDQCGTPLEAPCPRCGEPNRQGAKFCRRCGQAIGETPVRSSPLNVGTPAPDTYVPKHLAEKILASRHKLEGERKQVTVLFADIRGSTTLVEGLDPEEAQKLIDPVLQIMMDAVHKYEGTVNQVAGDGIMALFGAPLAHEDHALRACYAALAMQEEMRRYRQRLGQSEESGLQIGVGMNSGEVVLRSIDIDINIEYTAIGHTTHLAARMQELAGPAIVLISSTTLRQVEALLVDPSIPCAKGFQCAAYSLIGTTSARTRPSWCGSWIDTAGPDAARKSMPSTIQTYRASAYIDGWQAVQENRVGHVCDPATPPGVVLKAHRCLRRHFIFH